MSQRILIVEDDLNLGFLLVELLEDEGYAARLAKDGISGLKILKKEKFDLCIFDIMMPGLDGFNLAKHLKDIRPSVPFIFLTARIQKEDKLKGYNIGADDYITKPFEEEELLCKIQVILRRTATEEEATISQFEIGKYTFLTDRMELRYEDEITRMTETESKVLYQLCTHQNRVLRRDEAVERIYGKRDYFLGRSFDVFISKIRKMLSKDPDVSIENVYRVGFILNVK